jgi:hypothetical protein
MTMVLMVLLMMLMGNKRSQDVQTVLLFYMTTNIVVVVCSTMIVISGIFMVAMYSMNWSEHGPTLTALLLPTVTLRLFKLHSDLKLSVSDSLVLSRQQRESFR